MKSRTGAVVIGDRIAGVATLYHLTQEGWSDVVLVERDELTSGTTWHSAAQVTNFGVNQTMVGLKSHSIPLVAWLSHVLGANLGSGFIPVWTSRGMPRAARLIRTGNLLRQGTWEIAMKGR